MKPFAETIRSVLAAVLVWGTAGTPGMMLCTCDDDAGVEWALASLSASGTAMPTCEAASGGGQCCGRCDDIPGRAGDLNRLPARGQRVTVAAALASLSIPAIVLAVDSGSRAGLPQQPPPNVVNLRSVILLI